MSEKLSHTPEPWFVRDRGIGYEVFNGDPAISGSYPVNSEFRETFTKEDCERIVACVNACAGLPDPDGALDALSDAVKLLGSYLACDAERREKGDPVTMAKPLPIYPNEIRIMEGILAKVANMKRAVVAEEDATEIAALRSRASTLSSQLHDYETQAEEMRTLTEQRTALLEALKLSGRAVGMLNSMVACAEQHSPSSLAQLNEFRDAYSAAIALCEGRSEA